MRWTFREITRWGILTRISDTTAKSAKRSVFWQCRLHTLPKPLEPHPLVTLCCWQRAFQQYHHRWLMPFRCHESQFDISSNVRCWSRAQFNRSKRPVRHIEIGSLIGETVKAFGSFASMMDIVAVSVAIRPFRHSNGCRLCQNGVAESHQFIKWPPLIAPWQMLTSISVTIQTIWCPELGKWSVQDPNPNEPPLDIVAKLSTSIRSKRNFLNALKRIEIYLLFCEASSIRLQFRYELNRSVLMWVDMDPHWVCTHQRFKALVRSIPRVNRLTPTFTLFTLNWRIAECTTGKRNESPDRNVKKLISQRSNLFSFGEGKPKLNPVSMADRRCSIATLLATFTDARMDRTVYTF